MKQLYIYSNFWVGAGKYIAQFTFIKYDVIMEFYGIKSEYMP